MLSYWPQHLREVLRRGGPIGLCSRAPIPGGPSSLHLQLLIRVISGAGASGGPSLFRLQLSPCYTLAGEPPRYRSGCAYQDCNASVLYIRLFPVLCCGGW